jgi:pimeloyl-ACP methyl ester carboxylesterase
MQIQKLATNRRAFAVLNIVLSGAALYAALVGGLYLLQESLIFPRGAASLPSFPLPARARRQELLTADGARLIGNLVPASRPSRGLFIGFSGNAWNVDDFTVFLANRLHDLDILAFHYRGYGPSDGTPSEKALFADAELILDHYRASLQPRRAYVGGFSLGSGVAAYLARHRPIDGLLLVTPFDSIEAVARERYPWVPVGRLLKHRFRSDRYLEGLDVPTAVVLASNDSVVPRDRSRALVEHLVRPVLVETVPDCTHGGIYDEDQFDVVMRTALDRLEAAAEAPDGPSAPPAPSSRRRPGVQPSIELRSAGA